MYNDERAGVGTRNLSQIKKFDEVLAQDEPEKALATRQRRVNERLDAGAFRTGSHAGAWEPEILIQTEKVSAQPAAGIPKHLHPRAIFMLQGSRQPRILAT